MSKFETVLITGATSGIGRAAALGLARAGHRIFATGRRVDALASLEREAQSEGLRIEALALDITRPESIEAARAEIERRTEGRGVDVLINNAGYALVGPVETLTDRDLRAQFDTNVLGLLAVTRAFLPRMRERGFGRILNVSSVGGRFTMPLAGAYHATKHAVEALSDALRMELAPFNIQVVIIEPGMIRTEFNDRMLETVADGVDATAYAASVNTAMGRINAMERISTGPAPVVAAMRRAISSRWPRARYVAPGLYRLGLALMRCLPTRLLDSVMRVAFGLSRARAQSAGQLKLGGAQ